MKKKSKNISLYLLAITLLLTFNIGTICASTYINYFGISMTETEYTNLINLGFNENEIYYMNDETFNDNKDRVATLEVQNVNYYKTIYTNLNGESFSQEITQNEYENQSAMNSRGVIETTYKRMVSTLSRQTSSDTFRFKVSLIWNRFPSVRSHDIIGVGFEEYDQIYISSPIYFNYTYCDEDENCTTSTAYKDRKSLQKGASAVYKLPTDDISSLDAVLYYDVSKIDSSSTITELHMVGDYAHATTTVNSGYGNHTVHIGGLQLYASIINSYDNIPVAENAWTGTW